MIKTIFFDLGNVLVFFSHPKMFTQIAACTGLSFEEVKTLIVDEGLGELYERGEITTGEIYRLFKTFAPKQFSRQELDRASSDIFVPNDLIYPLIYSLKNQGLRLVLLSNISANHFEFLSGRYPILDAFDVKILSFEVGARKPDPNIYQAALQVANCSAQECFYTDDIPEYIQAAKIHGIDAEVFLDVTTLKKHLAKRSLRVSN